MAAYDLANLDDLTGYLRSHQHYLTALGLAGSARTCGEPKLAQSIRSGLACTHSTVLPEKMSGIMPYARFEPSISGFWPHSRDAGGIPGLRTGAPESAGWALGSGGGTLGCGSGNPGSGAWSPRSVNWQPGSRDWLVGSAVWTGGWAHEHSLPIPALRVHSLPYPI